MRTTTYLKAINEAMRLEMERDPKIVVLGEDIAGGAGRQDQGIIDVWGGPFATYKGLISEFGAERVIDTPISEAAYIGMAVGAAMTGLRPVADLMFIDFVTVCGDALLNYAAKMRYMHAGKVSVPLTVKTNMGAGVSGATHHSQAWCSIFTHVPGLKVVAPSTPYDAKGLLLSAIRDDDPVVFCEHKMLYGTRGDVPEDAYTVPLGTAVVRREGTKATIVAYSLMVHRALAAAERLQGEGIDVEVIDLRSLSPLDEDAIVTSVAKTGRLVIVDEDTPRCGVAADIAARVSVRAFYHLQAPIEMVTAPHTPIPFSPNLEQEYMPSEGRIIQAVRNVLAA